jgi:hypothetical protein
VLHETELHANILKRLFHDTWIRTSEHTILERGHINISTLKRLICPPTGIIEGWFCQALRTSSCQGINVKRQHRHITLNSYLSMRSVPNDHRNAINCLAGGSHVKVRMRKEYWLTPGAEGDFTLGANWEFFESFSRIYPHITQGVNWEQF